MYVEFAAGSQDLSSGRAYLVPKAKLVYKEAITAKDNYEKLHRELQIYREKVPNYIIQTYGHQLTIAFH